MARYIDMDLFLEWQANRQETGHEMGWDAIKQCLFDDYVKADVQPVKHAHWIEHGEALVEGYRKAYVYLVNCSNCGRQMFIDDYNRYCPNCGAVMDEEVE